MYRPQQHDLMMNFDPFLDTSQPDPEVASAAAALMDQSAVVHLQQDMYHHHQQQQQHHHQHQHPRSKSSSFDATGSNNSYSLGGGGSSSSSSSSYYPDTVVYGAGGASSLPAMYHPYVTRQKSATIEKIGRWSNQEHELFLQGLDKYGRCWKDIASVIPTRTVVQIRTHAQKYFQRLDKQKIRRDSSGDLSTLSAKLPPPHHEQQQRDSIQSMAESNRDSFMEDTPASADTLSQLDQMLPSTVELFHMQEKFNSGFKLTTPSSSHSTPAIPAAAAAVVGNGGTTRPPGNGVAAAAAAGEVGPFMHFAGSISDPRLHSREVEKLLHEEESAAWNNSIPMNWITAASPSARVPVGYHHSSHQNNNHQHCNSYMDN